MLDPSLKPDPGRKGSYYRRFEDISRALIALGVDRLPATIQFVTYYFGCEKLARGIVGVHLRLPAHQAYHHRRPLRLTEIEKAAADISLSFSGPDLQALFADFNEQHLIGGVLPGSLASARHARNTLIHDLGPSNVARLAAHAQPHIPKMRAFLGCVGEVLEYQKDHFSGIP